MHTVMIVEDELLVRIGLIESIPWKKLDLKIVAEESNGLEAYDTYLKLKPDIVVADIKIPGMNGLKLLQCIRQQDESCAFIVITCVEDFSILKEMMDLGVISYMVKATIDVEDVINAMKKARQYLVDHGRMGIQQNLQDDSETALYEYICSKNMSSQTFINRCNNMIGNRISGFIQVDISKKSTLTDILYYSVKNIVIERFAKWSTISSKLDYGCILILFHTIPDRKLFAQHVRDLCEYVNTTLGVIIKVTACFYEMDISLLPGVFKICDKRNDGADYLFDHGLLMLNHEGRIESTIIEDCLECLRGNTWAFRDGFSVAEFKGYVDKLETSIFQGWATFSRSAFLLGRYIISKKHLSHTVIDDFSMYLKAEKSVEALFDYLKSEIISPALKELQDGERQEINTVLCFVAEHLDSDLSLSSVAKRVGLHPTYFSYLFKQEMGTNFIDFVNTLRIEKARTLLMNRSLTIKDISEQCGFSDVTYFSRKFKQTVGMSPNAWRLQK